MRGAGRKLPCQPIAARQPRPKAAKASVAEVDEPALNPLITSKSRRRRSNDAGPGGGEGVALSFAVLVPDGRSPLQPAITLQPAFRS